MKIRKILDLRLHPDEALRAHRSDLHVLFRKLVTCHEQALFGVEPDA
jgi:hypothetical protein